MRRDTMCEMASRGGRRLEAEVSASLHGSGYAALSFVSCRAPDDGQVVLEGSVPTYYLKQMAQAFAQRVAGVQRIENRLAVRRAELARAPR